MYCRDLRSWLLGDNLFCCFACPSPHIRNSLGRVHKTLPHPLAGPVQHHKTIPSTSPPALCQKYLWHLQETVCYLYWAESEQNRICPWQDRQGKKCIQVHKTFNVGNKNCFQSESPYSSCLNQQGKVYQNQILVRDGTSFLNHHIMKVKFFTAQISNTNLCTTILKGKILPSIYQQLWDDHC